MHEARYSDVSPQQHDPPMRLSTILLDTLRFLSFRRPSAALYEHSRAFVVFGLVCAWLAGIGRYWDHPNAYFWQYLGLGSVIYVLLLASLLWLLLWPVCIRRVRWRSVLIFVALTSPLAWLYALPVERWMSTEDAAGANSTFLLIVALWRVILLVLFLRRVARLTHLESSILCGLPLTLIVAALALLNLEHATFELMAGLGELDPRGPSYFLVQLLAAGSLLISPVLLAGYGLICYYTAKERKQLQHHDC
jgi:hypothetical protein